MSKRIYLTDRSVQSLKATKKDRYIWDTKLAGFAVRQRPSVKANNGKSWVVYRRHDGKTTKTILGKPPQMNAETARIRARAFLLTVDFPESEDVTLNIPTFAEFATDHWQTDLQRMKPSTQRGIRSYLNRQLLPNFGNMRLDRITRKDVLKWFDHYSRTSPGAANQALGLLRQILISAMRFDFIAYSPVKGVMPNKRQRPMRVLSNDEIARLHQALDVMRPRMKNAVDIIRMLMLTGCRSGEIRQLRWREIRENKLYLEDSKTGPRIIWLSTAAKALLEARQTQAKTYVFPSGRRPDTPFHNIDYHWHIIRSMAGLDGVRLHDLRHSFASHAIRSGLPVPVIQKLLGHSSPVMTMRYIHYADDDVAKAAEGIGEKLQEFMNLRPPPKLGSS